MEEPSNNYKAKKLYELYNIMMARKRWNDAKKALDFCDDCIAAGVNFECEEVSLDGEPGMVARVLVEGPDRSAQRVEELFLELYELHNKVFFAYFNLAKELKRAGKTDDCKKCLYKALEIGESLDLDQWEEYMRPMLENLIETA